MTDTVNNTGRFSIGEKIFAINFKATFLDDAGKMVERCTINPYLAMHYFSKGKVNIQTVVLTVEEHHKVAISLNPEGEKDNDGYKLKSKNGTEFVNQYPYATYQQLDEDMNWLFYNKNSTANKVEMFVDVRQIYGHIHVRTMELDNSYREHFVGILNAINKAFEESFPGKELNIVAFARAENGITKVLPGVPITVIVDKIT